MAKPAPVSTGRNFISGASAEGIRVEINGAQSVVPWSSIELISAANVVHGLAAIFVIGFELHGGCSLMLSEIEPAWSEVVDLLHIHLDDVEPFAVWGPLMIAEPAVIVVYDSGISV